MASPPSTIKPLLTSCQVYMVLLELHLALLDVHTKQGYIHGGLATIQCPTNRTATVTAQLTAADRQMDWMTTIQFLAAKVNF
jgi:hypothetical protein